MATVGVKGLNNLPWFATVMVLSYCMSWTVLNSTCNMLHK